MKTILVIEDDLQLQKAYFQKLVQGGYRVLQAFSGSEGLEVAKKNQPDLIILDIMLGGGINGYDVLESIKAVNSLKTIPVVVLTNLDCIDKTAQEIGAVDCLVKTDVSLDQLEAVIKKYLS